jgi:hypothetical protein
VAIEHVQIFELMVVVGGDCSPRISIFSNEMFQAGEI